MEREDTAALKAWVRKVQRAKRSVLSHINHLEPPPSPLDQFLHIRERLTRAGESENISKRVVRQLQASERAYKGWETRRNKEQDNAGHESGQHVGAVEGAEQP